MNRNRDENKSLSKDNEDLSVKEEQEVTVKQELVECLVCSNRTTEHSDLSTASTASGTTLCDYLCKFTPADITKTIFSSKFICKTCLNLVNILERAELEYLKLKEEFQSILSKNPLFETQTLQVTVSLDPVKNESVETFADKNLGEDSEDEPLALTKKKRHRRLDKRKKKTLSDSKRKVRSKNCNDRYACRKDFLILFCFSLISKPVYLSRKAIILINGVSRYIICIKFLSTSAKFLLAN